MSGTLLLVDGLSGAGKTLLQNHAETLPRVRVIQKYTDRPHNISVPSNYSDQQRVSPNEFDALVAHDGFRTHLFAGVRYGFWNSELWRDDGSDSRLMVVRHLPILKQLKQEGPGKGTRVIKLFVACPEDRRRKFVRQQHHCQHEAQARLGRDRNLYPEGRRDAFRYDYHIENEGSKEDLYKQFEQVLGDLYCSTCDI